MCWNNIKTVAKTSIRNPLGGDRGGLRLVAGILGHFLHRSTLIFWPPPGDEEKPKELSHKANFKLHGQYRRIWP